MSKFNVNELGLSVTSPNVFVVLVDFSGSMDSYEKQMKQGMESLKNGLNAIEEKGSIYINRIAFSDCVSISGFNKLLDFPTSYSANGCTSLYDAIVAGKEELLGRKNQESFIETLEDEGYTPKASMYIWSDGLDNDSDATLKKAKRAIEELQSREIAVGFISFGDTCVSIAKDLGIYETNIYEATSDKKGIEKSFSALKKSCTLQSKSSMGITVDLFKD